MAVETRRKPALATFTNHLIAAVVCFLLTLFAFKWAINSPLLYIAFTIFYLSGVYSYSYSQAKIDHRDKERYDYKNALKIGLWGTFWVAIALIPHLIILLAAPDIAGYLAPAVRFWNYPFSFFIYGLENNGQFSYLSALILLLLPLMISYMAYFLGEKGFSATEKLYNFTHRK